jgi:hypothetical protein
MLLRILFWSAMAFAIVMAVLAFGTLMLLACAAYPRAELLRIAERLTLVGAVIEVVQSIPWLHRDCDIKDLLADIAAIAIAMIAVLLYRQIRPHDA